MKLLMISGDRALASGKQGAFYNTLSELHKHFDRIDVICPHVPVRRYDMAIFGNVHVHPAPLPLVLQWLWIWHKGRALIREQQPEVMTVHEYPPFYNGIGARLLRGVPYLLEIMHIPGLPRASGVRERLYRWLMRRLIAWDARPATAVRVINEHETPDFLVAAGIPRDRLMHVPAFYIDLDTFTPGDTPKQYDVIFIARLTRNKGIDLFLEAVRRARVNALVVGDGPLLKWAKAKARKEGLKIHFHGFAKDAAEIAELINQSRLLAMTSLNEGGPRVVLEALACGVPVVATPVGIVTDVLPPEAIEEWDAEAFARKINNILSDSALYTRLRESGLTAVQSFERKTAIARYAEAIKSIAQ